MHRHELSVLNALKKSKRMSVEELLSETGLGRDEAMWAVENLSKDGYIEVRKESVGEVRLTAEAEEYVGSMLPEQALIKRITPAGVALDTLKSRRDQIGLIWAKKKGLVAISKGKLQLTDKGKKAAKVGVEENKVLKALSKDKEAHAKYKGSGALDEFVKRGLVELKEKQVAKEIGITPKGTLALAKERQGEAEEIEALDRNAIANRTWVGKRFKEYNIEAPVEAEEDAIRHPLRSVMDELRDAYVGMGFREVSGPIIEPAFRVFDYLFMPQDHPARESMDTFFLSNPQRIRLEDKNLVKRIKEEHERAWHMDWSEQIAEQAVLRAHTTSVTGRYMHTYVQELSRDPKKYELPIKIFTLGRNFRNENIDYKHLSDFYQTDGIVIGKNLTLANLFDVLLKIYNSIGIKMRFKPLYYPFVEPGVSVEVEHEGEWLQLGGAGVIRREVTGVERKTLNVLAWGLGVERILLVKDPEIKSIASLFNPSAGWLRDRKAR